MATITKTGSYDAATAKILFAETEFLPLAQRWTAREKIKADMQRRWVRGGKVGPNPICLL